MGSFRVSTRNYLREWVQHAMPAMASGYSLAAITDGQGTIVARTSGSATSFGLVYDRGGGFGTENILFAGHGTRSKDLGVANLSNVFIRQSPTGLDVDKSTLGGWVPDSRGDGRAAFSVTQRYVHIDFAQALADELDIPEFWAGPYVDLARQPIAPMAWPQGYRDIVNDAEDGALWASLQADYIEELVLRWAELTQAELAEIAAVFHALRGRVNPLVIVPDTTLPQVLFGYLTTPSLPRAWDVPVVLDVQLGFRQMGHYLYA